MMRGLDLPLNAVLAALRTLLVDSQPRVLLAIQADHTIVVIQDDESAVLSETILAPFDEITAEQAARIKKMCEGRELSLSLPTSDVLCIELRLPRRGIVTLREAITYRLLAESPLRPDAMHFDTRRLPVGQSSADTLTAEVAICHRHSLTDLKRTLTLLGLSVHRIGFTRDKSPELEFMFECAPGIGSAAVRLYRNAALALGPVLIAILTILASWTFANLRGQAVRHEMAALSTPAKTAFGLLARQAWVVDMDAIVRDEVPPSTLTAILNGLSTAIPSSAYLSELRFDAGKLSLIGYGSDPSAVAAALGAMPGLTMVQLARASPANSGMVSFEISATVSIRGGR